MSAEKEITAMGSVSTALEGLEEDARIRVLQWAMSHYGVTGAPTAKAKGSVFSEAHDRGAVPFETLAELFEAANPSTEKDKALVAAYWVQVCQGNGSFQAQSLNDQLKDLGHGIGNITEALSQLKEERPASVLQLKKSGNSRQARKTYKLTLEGSRRVESMTQGGTNSE